MYEAKYLAFLVIGSVLLCLGLALIVLLSFNVVTIQSSILLVFIILFLSAGIFVLIEASNVKMENYSEYVFGRLDEILVSLNSTISSVSFYSDPIKQSEKDKFITDLIQIRQYYENISKGDIEAKVISTSFDDDITVIIIEAKSGSIIKKHSHKYSEFVVVCLGKIQAKISGNGKIYKLTSDDFLKIDPYSPREIKFIEDTILILRISPPFSYNSSEFKLLSGEGNIKRDEGEGDGR